MKKSLKALAAFFAATLFTLAFLGCPGGTDDGGPTPNLTGVSISGISEISSEGSAHLTATPSGENLSGTEITYSWEISSGGDYAELSATSGQSVTLTVKNQTDTEQSVTVTVKASYGETTVSANHKVTVAAKENAEEGKILSVSINVAGSPYLDSGDMPRLVAEAETIGNPTITYKWEIIDGSEYGSLSDTSGSWVELGAKDNNTGSDQSVTVQVTASDGTNSVSNMISLTVMSVEESKVTSVSISATRQADGSAYNSGESVASGEQIGLEAKVTSTGNPTITYKWEITQGSGFGEIVDADIYATTFTAKNSSASDQSVTVQVTASDGTNSVSDTISFKVKRGAEPLDALGVNFVSITGADVKERPAGESRNSPFYNATTESPVTVDSFQIADAELTYKLWKVVYDWATSGGGASLGYTFENEGQMGDNKDAYNGAHTESEPVTKVSWRDVVVWCNAASEREGLTPVYTYTSEKVTSPVRGNNGNYYVINADVNTNANGYRLPTEKEWEFAAWGGKPDATEWNYKYAGTDDKNELGDYAWYSSNSDNTTHSVRGKTANSAHLYDMSGNVLELCYSDSSTDKPYRGGAFDDGESRCQLTHSERFSLFRVCIANSKQRNALRFLQTADLPTGSERPNLYIIRRMQGRADALRKVFCKTNLQSEKN